MIDELGYDGIGSSGLAPVDVSDVPDRAPDLISEAVASDEGPEALRLRAERQRGRRRRAAAKEGLVNWGE
jgi:hypothetical protein